MQSSSIGIPEKSLRALFRKWEGIIKRQESGSIINFSSRTQNYRVNQFIDSHKLDASTYFVFNCATQTSSSKNELQSYINSRKITNKQRCVIFVINADLLLTDYKDLLEEFDRCALENTKYTVLYFFQNTITYSWMVKSVAPFSSLLKNIYIEQLISEQEVLFFVDKYARWTNCVITPTLLKQIIRYSGGRLWLASEMVREYAKNSKSSITFSDELERKLMVIWSEFLSVEQHVLKKIVFNIPITDASELEAYRYLRTTGVIIERSGELKIRGELLNTFIKKNFSSVVTGLSLISRDIYLNGVNISLMFSFRERALLRAFLLRKNEIISRDEIGAYLWNSKDFTDWAVDQAMRRIRLKLIKVGMKNKVINSVRGRGYVFTGK